MIGKILFFIGVIFIFAILTNVNFSPVYEKLASLRDSTLPYVDQVTEKSLQYSANVHLQEKLQPMINQLQGGGSP